MTSYSFKCKDIGMECGFETSAGERGALMSKIGAHAKEAHNMHTIPDDIMKKVEKAISVKQ